MDSIELHGRTTTYRVIPTPTGSGLRALTWGASTDAVLPPELPTKAEFDTEEDLLPHEFAVDGTRHVLESELRLHRVNGRHGAKVRLTSVTADEQKGTLFAQLRNELDDLEVDLEWIMNGHHDVVRRRATVRNTGDETIVLDRALTGAFSVFLPAGVDIDLLAGSWCHEYTPQQARLPCGTFSIESRQGLTSHLFAPTLSVRDPSNPRRGLWSVAMAWPGSFEINVNATSRAGWVRIALGLHSEEAFTLPPREELRLPEIHGLWAPDDNEAARRWHAFQRGLLRSTDATHRPVTYNSWYATEFDVQLSQQLELARTAAALGCEMFVVDDGWFMGRNSDEAGLGDWFADPIAFPEGLDPLISEVHRLGMRFGLWIEPEGINPNSDLFRKHPDWIHRSPDREPVAIRNQYVLNLGLPEVEQWVMGLLRRLLDGTGVDHLKWDMNRPIIDGGPPSGAHGREWSTRHTLAYLRILQMLREEFPHVTLETCSGGGARVSNAVLPFTDVVWPSDETGPRDRLEIQHGFLSAFPAAVMSSWVTDLDGLRDARTAPLAFRFCVAMCGVLSVGADIRLWNAEERSLATRMVEMYKSLRGIILQGEVHRHGMPREHGYAVEYGRNDSVVLFIFAQPGDGASVLISPQFAEPTMRVDATFGDVEWRGAEMLVHVDSSVGATIVVAERGAPIR